MTAARQNPGAVEALAAEIQRAVSAGDWGRAAIQAALVAFAAEAVAPLEEKLAHFMAEYQDEASLSDLRFANEELKKRLAEAVAAERERCAKLMETYPDQTLCIWDRGDGPPGNGYVPTTNADRAAAIRDGSEPPHQQQHDKDDQNDPNSADPAVS